MRAIEILVYFVNSLYVTACSSGICIVYLKQNMQSEGNVRICHYCRVRVPVDRFNIHIMECVRSFNRHTAIGRMRHHAPDRPRPNEGMDFRNYPPQKHKDQPKLKGPQKPPPPAPPRSIKHEPTTSSTPAPPNAPKPPLFTGPPAPSPAPPVPTMSGLGVKVTHGPQTAPRQPLFTGPSPVPAVRPQRSPEPERRETFPCFLCGHQMSLEQLDTHPARCRNREQRCRDCHGTYPHQLIQQHYEVCAQRAMRIHLQIRRRRQQQIEVERPQASRPQPQPQPQAEHRPPQERERAPQHNRANQERVQEDLPVPLNRAGSVRSASNEPLPASERLTVPRNQVRQESSESNSLRRQPVFQQPSDRLNLGPGMMRMEQVRRQPVRPHPSRLPIQNDEGSRGENNSQSMSQASSRDMSFRNPVQRYVSAYANRSFESWLRESDNNSSIDMEEHIRRMQQAIRPNGARRNAASSEEIQRAMMNIRNQRDYEVARRQIRQLAQRNRADQPQEQDEDRPLSKKELKLIPTKSYTFQNRKDVDVCSICTCNIRKKAKVRDFKCGHIFHKKCIDEWLGRNARCPLCKANLRENIHQTSSVSKLIPQSSQSSNMQRSHSVPSMPNVAESRAGDQ